MSGPNYNETSNLNVASNLESLRFEDDSIQIQAATTNNLTHHLRDIFFVQTFDPSSSKNVSFDLSGYRMLNLDLSGTITWYELSTQYDTNSGVLQAGSITVTNTSWARYSPDGTSIFYGLNVVDGNSNVMFQQILDTPFDLNTITVTPTSLSSIFSNIGQAAAFRPDGLQILVVKDENVIEVDLNIPWEFSGGAAIGSTIPILEGASTENLFGIDHKSDGYIGVLVDTANDEVREFALKVPFDWSERDLIFSLDFGGTGISNPANVNSVTYALDGSNIFFCGGTEGIFTHSFGVTVFGDLNVEGDLQVIGNSRLNANVSMFNAEVTGNFTFSSSSTPGSFTVFASSISLQSTGVITSDPLLQNRKSFAVSSTTALLGFAAIYSCTDTSAERTLTISTADIQKGSTANPWFFDVKDESGGAGTFNIIIDTQGSEQIDGLDSVAIVSDHGVARLYSNGTEVFTR